MVFQFEIQDTTTIIISTGTIDIANRRPFVDPLPAVAYHTAPAGSALIPGMPSPLMGIPRRHLAQTQIIWTTGGVNNNTALALVDQLPHTDRMGPRRECRTSTTVGGLPVRMLSAKPSRCTTTPCPTLRLSQAVETGRVVQIIRLSLPSRPVISHME